MAWRDVVLNNVNVGDTFRTPGRGLKGDRAKDFKVIYKESDRLFILSGKSCLPLERACFEAIENAFNNQPHSRWRVSSLRDNEPYKNSADKLIREVTNSNLARGNYVCAMLESLGLVKYEMDGYRKCITK